MPAVRKPTHAPAFRKRPARLCWGGARTERCNALATCAPVAERGPCPATRRRACLWTAGRSMAARETDVDLRGKLDGSRTQAIALAVLLFSLPVPLSRAAAEDAPPPISASTCSKVGGVITCTCVGPAACRAMEDFQCKGGRSRCAGTTCSCEMKRTATFPKAVAPSTGAAIDGAAGN